jgi:hypothetical protein
LVMMHDLNSMSLHCVSETKSCCWTCYPWYNGQKHEKLHVLSTLKRWITIITLFDCGSSCLSSTHLHLLSISSTQIGCLVMW